LTAKQGFIGLAFCTFLGLTANAQTIGMRAAMPGHARAHFRLVVPKETGASPSAAPVYLSTPVGLTPANVHTLYDLPTKASALGGKGETIALVDAFDDPNIEADLAIFDAQFNLPACTSANGCFKKEYAAGSAPGVDAGWALEMSLDVEWAHAIAPQAKILLVEAASDNLSDLLQAVIVAASNANVVSMSWGAPEFSAETQVDGIFQAFSSVAFVASSGDGGFGAFYPAASPYVLAVGGTTIEVAFSNRGVARRQRELGWSSSSGALSQFEPPSQAQSVFLTGFPNRAVPDVAYIGDPVTGIAVFDSVPYQGFFGWLQVGGTSAGTPQWSALIALAGSASGAPINASQAAYALYSSLGNNNGPLNDITIGTNGLCGTACLAAPGYDFITGLGTPNGAEIIQTLTPRP
jgi:subtilase family serine protease